MPVEVREAAASSSAVSPEKVAVCEASDDGGDEECGGCGAMEVEAHARDPKNLFYDEDWHCCARVAKNWLICGRKRGRWPFQWFVGPDWPCMCVTYSLILAPSGAFLVLVAARLHVAVVVLGSASLSVLLVAFSSTACSDPGIVYH